MALSAQAEVTDRRGARSHRRQAGERGEAWSRLRLHLAAAVGALEDGQFLILQTRGEGTYYVQFSGWGAEGLQAEAVSNRFLPAGETLDRTAEARLRRLGWKPPTDIGEGPPNWWRHYSVPVPAAEVAELAAATLMRVYDVSRPSRLVYRAFSRGGQEILLPELGIGHLAPAAGQSALAERVDAALRSWLQLDKIAYDEEGDAPIRCGEAVVFVRTMEDPPLVAVISPMLQEVEMTSGLLQAVNDINNSTRFARAFISGRRVLVAAEVEPGPGLDGALGRACDAVGWISDHWGGRLQARFGGTTFFGEAKPAVSEGSGGVYL